jgi:peptide deformylase
MTVLLYNILMLKIVSVPDKSLTLPTQPVDVIDGNIKELVMEMEELLATQSDPQGVGLAANQVGIGLSIFIIKKTLKSNTQVFINPKILKSGVRNPKTKKSRRKPVKLEGCLSIPRIWGSVKRADKILIQYQDLTAKIHEKWFKGFEATIIQHEIDHLQGVVFTQRSLEQKAPLYKEVGGKLKPFEV